MGLPDCPCVGLKNADGSSGVCAKLSQALGYKHSVHEGICKLHVDAGGWDVPVMDVPALRKHMKNAACARLGHGDCPKYQWANPINLQTLSQLAAALCTQEERERVFPRIADAWASIKPEDGGHPDKVVEEKLREVAKIWRIDLEAL